jgi:hypothetical protein
MSLRKNWPKRQPNFLSKFIGMYITCT